MSFWSYTCTWICVHYLDYKWHSLTSICEPVYFLGRSLLELLTPCPILSKLLKSILARMYFCVLSLCEGCTTFCVRVIFLLLANDPISLLATFSLWISTACSEINICSHVLNSLEWPTILSLTPLWHYYSSPSVFCMSNFNPLLHYWVTIQTTYI